MRFKSRKFREEAGEGEGSTGPTIEELQAQLTDLTGQFDRVKNKNDELLTEAKRAKNAKREAEELAKREADKKLLASSNYEELHKSSELEREKLNNELSDLKNNISKGKVETAALKIAGEIAEGDNISLISDFITKRLKYADGLVQVVNDSGELTVSSLDELKKEFETNAKFSALVKGNKSSGGGASGGSNGGGAAKEMPRQEFDALDHIARAKFIKSGGIPT